MSLFDQVNTAENSGEESAKEKHLPVLSVKKLADNRFEVHIHVGGGSHPNEPAHWIQWAGLRINECFIGRVEFSAKIMEPVCTFTVTPDKLPATLSVVARCNIHGLWRSDCTLA